MQNKVFAFKGGLFQIHLSVHVFVQLFQRRAAMRWIYWISLFRQSRAGVFNRAVTGPCTTLMGPGMTWPRCPVHQNRQGDGINPVVPFTRTPGRTGSVPSTWSRLFYLVNGPLTALVFVVRGLGRPSNGYLFFTSRNVVQANRPNGL